MTAPRFDADIDYAPEEEGFCRLDLYRPAESADPCPVVVYLHGGGWALGDKADGAKTRAVPLAESGVAVASVNYRLSDRAVFPAQLHDVKGAVRWLRAHGERLGLRTDRIGAFGASAGGHLAALLGLTAERNDLEGTTGGNLDRSSAIQAVVDWFGPSDLVAVGSRSRLEAALLGNGFEAKLLGLDTVADGVEAARAASPRWQVHAEAPPFLIVHGDRDHLVSVQESMTLHEGLVAHGVDSTLVLLGGAGHDDARFDEPGTIEMVASFLRRRLS